MPTDFPFGSGTKKQRASKKTTPSWYGLTHEGHNDFCICQHDGTVLFGSAATQYDRCGFDLEKTSDRFVNFPIRVLDFLRRNNLNQQQQ